MRNKTVDHCRLSLRHCVRSHESEAASNLMELGSNMSGGNGRLDAIGWFCDEFDR